MKQLKIMTHRLTLSIIAVGALAFSMLSCTDKGDDETRTLNFSNLTDGKITVVESGEFVVELVKSPARQTVEFLSSDPEVFTVNSDGRITGVKEGNATLTARNVNNHSVKAECPVNVLKAPIKVSSIEVTGTGISVGLGGRLDLNDYITVLPENAADKKLLYSVEPEGNATIDENGIITPVKAGKITVSMEAADGGGAKASCQVTVAAPVSEIKVPDDNSMDSPIELMMSQKLDLKLFFTVLPANASQNLSYEYTSMGGEATIDENNILKPTRTGMIVVKATATDGSNKSASLYVDIYTPPILVQSIIPLEGNSASSRVIVEFKNTLDLKKCFTVLPEDATNKTLSYTIDKAGGGDATVSGDILTPKVIGPCVINAFPTDGGKAAFATLFIDIIRETVLISEIQISGENSMTNPIKASIGKTLDVNDYLTILPEDATYKTLTYIVTTLGGGAAIATVSDKGILTPTAEGTILLTARSTDGSGKAANVFIKIGPAPVYVTAIKVPDGNSFSSPMDIRINVPFDTKDHIIVLPENASDKTLKYSLTPVGGSATIDAEGILTPTAAGKVIISAEAADGKGAKNNLIVNIVND